MEVNPPPVESSDIVHCCAALCSGRRCSLSSDVSALGTASLNFHLAMSTSEQRGASLGTKEGLGSFSRSPPVTFAVVPRLEV